MTQHRTREPMGERVTIDRAHGRYCVQYDPSSDCDLATVVVQALADVAEVDPVEIGPLNEVVDPDAMNQLFRPRPDGTPREGGRLAFTLAGHEVVVRGAGRIEISPAVSG